MTALIRICLPRLLLLTLTPALWLAGTCHAIAASESGDITLDDVDTITILPIVFPADQTSADRKENFESLFGELDEYIYKALLRKLAMKGYVLDKPHGWSPPENWSVETLKPMTPQELAALAPASASYVALLFVEHVESSYEVVHSSGNARVSAMILHRDSGTVVWQRGGEGDFTEHVLQIFNPLSGPVGMLFTPNKHAAIEDAFGKLFAELPEKSWR